jgi:hypothetical protein
VYIIGKTSVSSADQRRLRNNAWQQESDACSVQVKSVAYNEAKGWFGGPKMTFLALSSFGLFREKRNNPPAQHQAFPSTSCVDIEAMGQRISMPAWHVAVCFRRFGSEEMTLLTLGSSLRTFV